MTCESCGEVIPPEREQLHARGLDGARPACPKQDLVEIAMRADGRWDKMRAQHLAPGDAARLRYAMWTL
jgi:hypothetical protein